MAGLLDKVKIPEDRFELRLSGSGGQGMILAAVILGEAIGTHDNRNVTQSQSYGPEARGGACSANVVISEEKVAYPTVSRPDVLVLMSQEAYHTYKKDLREGIQVLYDSDLVQVEPGLPGHWVACPAMKLAEETGKKVVANIVMLGFFASVTGMLPKDAVKEAVLTSVPAHTKDLNAKAFDAGYEAGLKVKGKGG